MWNSNSLKPTTEGNNKGNYIYRKLKDLSDTDVICLVETHLTDNCENKNDYFLVKALKIGGMRQKTI